MPRNFTKDVSSVTRDEAPLVSAARTEFDIGKSFLILPTALLTISCADMYAVQEIVTAAQAIGS